MTRAHVLSIVMSCALVVACAADRSAEKSTTTTPENAGAGAGASGSETHSPEWFKLDTARGDLRTSEQRMDASMSDCEAACKALASLERAVNHICAVAEPEECSDARLRADAARKAVNDKCGGC
jgi:hypothetical protein